MTKGAGVKPGNTNAVKPAEQRQTVKKFVGYTQEEFDAISEAMRRQKVENFSRWANAITLDAAKAINEEGNQNDA